MRLLPFHIFLPLFFGWAALLPDIGAAQYRSALEVYEHVQRTDALSDAAEISLLTALPGEKIYTLFGHSAFRVRDPLQDLDVTFNYGTFSFGNPLVFGLEFTYGRLDYFLSVSPSRWALASYRAEGRPVFEQVLHLTPAQRGSVFAFLQKNARPEHRYYRYDFLFDNCSTRLRDVLLAALGDAIRFAPEPDPETSFRRLLDPYVADRPFLDLGFDLLLGTPTDRRASPSEAMFLPLFLMEGFDHAQVQAGSAWRPLAAPADTILWVDGYEGFEASLPWAAVAGWMLLALGVGLAYVGHRRGYAGRRFDAALFGLVGLAGLLMVFMWFLSEHDVTRGNWNLLWAWPTHLAAAWTLGRGRYPRWTRGYLLGAAAAALLTAAGWYLWPQDLHPAVFPILLLLGFRALFQFKVQGSTFKVGELSKQL